MQVTQEMLARPAAEVAHRLARDLAGNVIDGRKRLRDAKDGEALHDFRVALRRLRTILRAYGPFLVPRLGKRVQRRLRTLAGATSTSRDLEVHIAWLIEARATLTPRERTGASWMIRRLRARKRAADLALRQETGRRFEFIRRRLTSRLQHYTLTCDLDDPSLVPCYGLVTRDLMATLGGAMQKQLAEVRSLADQAAAHEARIRGKRLRYVLEPMADAVDGGEELLATLRRLQEQLGELHDANVFAREIADAVNAAAAEEGRRMSEGVLGGQTPQIALGRARRRDPRPGLMALAGRLRQRSEQLFAELTADEWIGGRVHPFFERLAGVGRVLEAASRPSIEIERKYLLSAVPVEARAAIPVEIEQGYLPGERLVERLRRVHSAEGVSCWRTVKIGAGLQRTELEEAATPEVFDALWALTAGRRVCKRRMVVRDGELRWEIDEFTDRTLVLAEVELRTPDQLVVPPDWLMRYIVDEVTGDPAYDNAALAR